MGKQATGTVALIGAVALAGGLAWAWQQGQLGGRGAQEAALQKAEIQECKRRLAGFYQAWKQYRKDHHGAEPGNLEALVPRYVKDPKLFQCPTATRVLQHGGGVDQGSFKIGKTMYSETYGLMWLTSGSARLLKHEGEHAPLVQCTTHMEAMYRAVYGKKAPLGSLAPDKRRDLAGAVARSAVLTVRRSGEVSQLSPDEE